jgi:hypothetical protein
VQSFKMSAVIPNLIIFYSTLAVLQVAAAEQMKTSPRGWKAAMEAEGGLAGDSTSQGGSLNAANVMSPSCSSPPLLLLGPHTTWLIGGVAFALGLLVEYIWNRLSTQKHLKEKPPRIHENIKTVPPQKAPPPPEAATPAAAALLVEETYEMIETIETSYTSSKPNTTATTPMILDTAATAPHSSEITTTALGSLGGIQLEPTATTNNTSELEAATGSSDTIVMAVARKLSSLDFNQMSTKEQLLALELMLRVDHTQHAKRIGTEANKIQSERLGVAKHAAAHTIAKDAVTLARERTEEFKKTCSDSLVTGVCLMAIIGGYQAWKRGFFTPLFHKCGSLPRSTSSWGPFGLWGAYRSAEVAVCYTSGLSDTLLGIFVLLAVPWAVYRTGLLNDYHRLPVAKVFIGLGLVCGTAGHVAVSKIGGDGWTWFLLWQFWTLLHVIMSTTAFRMCQRDVAVALQQIGVDGSAVSAEKFFQLHTGGLNVGVGGNGSLGGSSKVAWIAAGLWLLSGVVLPILIATLPFLVVS